MVKKTGVSAASKKAVAAPKNAPKSIAKAEKPASPVVQRLKKRDGPKWDKNKLAMGQFLSMTSYFTVLKIGSLISIKNQMGHTFQASKSVLETMYSADHFDREVGLNMTGLAELLQSVGDTVFTVQFRRQVNEQDAYEALQAASTSAFKDQK